MRTAENESQGFAPLVLNFNCRLATELCQHLNKALLSTGLDLSSGNSREEQLPGIITRLLPGIRLLVYWLVAYLNELSAADNNESQDRVVTKCYQAIADTGRLLMQATVSIQDKCTAPYLLQEDEECQGQMRVGFDTMPEKCRLGWDVVENTLKPRRRDVKKLSKSPYEENVARIVDILTCVYFLAVDQKTPITVQASHYNGQEIFIFLVQGHNAAPSEGRQVSGLNGDIAMGKRLPEHASTEPVESLQRDAATDVAPATTSPSLQRGHSRFGSHSGTSSFDATISLADQMVWDINPLTDFQKKPGTTQPPAEEPSHKEYDVDSDLFAMVQDFVSPPAAQVTGSMSRPDSQGELPPSQPSSATFTTLPWAWNDLTTNPQEKRSTNGSFVRPSIGDHFGISPSGNQIARKSIDDPFTGNVSPASNPLSAWEDSLDRSAVARADSMRQDSPRMPPAQQPPHRSPSESSPYYQQAAPQQQAYTLNSGQASTTRHSNLIASLGPAYRRMMEPPAPEPQTRFQYSTRRPSSTTTARPAHLVPEGQVHVSAPFNHDSGSGTASAWLSTPSSQPTPNPQRLSNSQLVSSSQPLYNSYGTYTNPIGPSRHRAGSTDNHQAP